MLDSALGLHIIEKSFITAMDTEIDSRYGMIQPPVIAWKVNRKALLL